MSNAKTTKIERIILDDILNTHGFGYSCSLISMLLKNRGYNISSYKIRPIMEGLLDSGEVKVSHKRDIIFYTKVK